MAKGRDIMRIVIAGVMALSLAFGPADAATAHSTDGAMPKPAAPSKRKVIVSQRPQSAHVGCRGFFECLFGGPPRRGGRFERVTREIVAWDDAKYQPGTIVVHTPERALYYVLGDGEALRYRVGVGRDGFRWGGASRIIDKQEWPEWRPPKTMIEREAAKGHIIPDYMAGGPNNPLGARALYIGGTLFRIHGTNDAASIGGAVSSGCIRMMNADVIDLYDRVRIGSRVVVYQ